MLEHHKSLCGLLGDTTKDIKIDNQQVRLLFDIGYLLGMIDGEGAIQIANKYVSKNGMVCIPKIGIYNSNPIIIETVISIFKKLGMAFYIYKPKIHGKEQRPCYRIEIIGFKRVKSLTDLLMHFPCGKSERIQIINDFCTQQLETPWGERQSKEAFIRIERFKKLLKAKNFEHRGAITSETIRSSS